MIFGLIYTIYFYLILVVSFFIGTTIALCFVPFNKDRHRPFQIAAQLWARFLAFFSGIKVTVAGLENIPKDQPMIIVANHQGAADILIVLAFLPVYFRFAIKKELFNIPVFGWYLHRAGYFPINRKVVLSAYKTLETISDFIKNGASVLIFPEGTRSTTGELGKFHRGSLLAALKSGAPILPVAISGSYKMMPRGTWLIKPCSVKLNIGKLIYIKDEADYENKVEEVRTAIAKML